MTPDDPALVMRLRLAQAAAERLHAAQKGTPGGAATARAALTTEAPTETAGQPARQLPDGPIDIHEAAGALSWRQAVALRYLARLYRAGGGHIPWRRRVASKSPREAQAEAQARVDFRPLLYATNPAIHPALIAICAGDWPLDTPLPAITRAADAIADAMNLPAE